MARGSWCQNTDSKALLARFPQQVCAWLTPLRHPCPELGERLDGFLWLLDLTKVISANGRTKSHGVRPGPWPEKQAAAVVVRDLDSRKSPKYLSRNKLYKFKPMAGWCSSIHHETRSVLCELYRVHHQSRVCLSRRCWYPSPPQFLGLLVWWWQQSN